MSNNENVPCPLFSSSKTEILSTTDRHGKPLETRICCDNGLVFNHPIPTKAELEQFYTDEYRLLYKNTIEPKLKHHVRYGHRVAEQINANIDVYKNIKTVLDVGAGSGEALAIFARLGFEAEGIEPTKGYADYVARVFKADVFNGSIDDFQSDKTYDFIRLNHVLEHMRDPVEKLVQLKSLMAEDGILHVEVPDIRAYLANKSPGRIFHYGHIFNFANETLLMCAARAGLKERARFGPTSIYFEQCAPFEMPANKALADEIKKAHSEHLSGQFQPKSGIAAKVIGKLSQQISELITLKRLGDAEKIIDFYAAKLKTSLSV